MSNYTFKKEKDLSNKFDLTTVTISLEGAEFLGDIVTAFKEFLLACGYAESNIDDYIKLEDEE